MRKSQQAENLVIHRQRDVDDIRAPPRSGGLTPNKRQNNNAYRPLTTNKRARETYRIDSPSPSNLNLSHSASKSVSFS